MTRKCNEHVLGVRSTSISQTRPHFIIGERMYFSASKPGWLQGDSLCIKVVHEELPNHQQQQQREQNAMPNCIHVHLKCQRSTVLRTCLQEKGRGWHLTLTGNALKSTLPKYSITLSSSGSPPNIRNLEGSELLYSTLPKTSSGKQSHISLHSEKASQPCSEGIVCSRRARQVKT